MKRFLLLTLLALGVLGIGLYFVDTNLRARALADADSALAVQARLFANSVDRLLQWRMSEAFTFAALPSLRGFAAADETTRPARAAIALNELKAIVAADPNVRAASIADPAGAVILTTDGSMNADWSARVFVREALAGHLYASAPSRDFGEVAQYYSAPILDNAGNVVAAFVLRVAVREVWGALGNTPNVLLVDENSVRVVDLSATPLDFAAVAPMAPALAAGLLAEKQYGAEVTQIGVANVPALADALQRGAPATVTYRDASGQPMRAAIQRLATRPWSVVVSQNQDAILSSTHDAFWETLAFGAVALVAEAILWIALGSFERRP